MRPFLLYCFFLALGLVILLLISLWLGLLFGLGNYTDVAHLSTIRYSDQVFHYPPLPIQEASYQLSKYVLLGLLVSSGGVALWQYLRRGKLYQELRALRHELHMVTPLLGPWQALSHAERRTALLLFMALVSVRVWYLFHYPLYGDEIITYLSFVRGGPVVATSFYPLPNNHVLYSVLCSFICSLTDNFYLSTRLPTFLISGVGTAIGGLLLLRYTTYRVAALTVLLFGFFSHGLFQAVVGRGYFLQVVCTLVALVALLSLLRSTERPRLCWALLVVSSIIGLYAVPTHLLAFSGLVGVAGCCFAYQRQWQHLLSLALASLTIGIAVLLLYAPIIVVSGPAALFSNPFVTPRTDSFALLTTLDYLRRAEGELLGHNPLGILLTTSLTVAVMGAERWLLMPRQARMLLWFALGLIWLPYLLLAGKGMEAPARALSFRAFFLILAAAILYEELLKRHYPITPPALAVGAPVLLWACVSLFFFQRRAAPELQRNAGVAHVYALLQQLHASKVLVTHGHYRVYFSFFSASRHEPLQIEGPPNPIDNYSFYVADKKTDPPLSSSAVLLYENADVRLYQTNAVEDTHK